MTSPIIIPAIAASSIFLFSFFYIIFYLKTNNIMFTKPAVLALLFANVQAQHHPIAPKVDVTEVE